MPAEELSAVMVRAGLTTCVTGADAAPSWLAVMECVPTAREEVKIVALPAGSSVPVPRGLVPSRNVTTPLPPASSAVSVMPWPKTVEWADESRTGAAAKSSRASRSSRVTPGAPRGARRNVLSLRAE